MIAKQAGFKVTGSDKNVYPPMSDELEGAGIELHQGFDAEQLDNHPDVIVVGNVMKRGMDVVERMLNENMRKFEEAKQNVDDMMNYLIQILSLCVNGEDPATCEPKSEEGGCSGNCGTCGGCG